MTLDEFEIEEIGNNHPSTHYRHQLNIENSEHFGYTNGLEFKGTIVEIFDDGKQVKYYSRWVKK